MQPGAAIAWHQFEVTRVERKNTLLGGIADATTEKDRIGFLVRQIVEGKAYATLVQVKAVDAAERTVDVQPMVSQIDGAGNGIAHGIINAMPVFELRAGGSAIRALPRAGDIGLAVFCNSDISSVKSTKAPALPGSMRRNDWADGLFFGAFLGDAPSQFIDIDDDAGITITAAPGNPITLTSDDKIDAIGIVNTDTEYRVEDTRVVSARQSAIAGPTGGSTVDTQARTAINSILSAMRSHGLIET